MGDVIDLTLVSDARRYFQKLLDTRGLNYFLRKDGGRLFQIEQSKVEMIVRPAAPARGGPLPQGDPPRADPPGGGGDAPDRALKANVSRRAWGSVPPRRV